MIPLGFLVLNRRADTHGADSWEVVGLTRDGDQLTKPPTIPLLRWSDAHAIIGGLPHPADKLQLGGDQYRLAVVVTAVEADTEVDYEDEVVISVAEYSQLNRIANALKHLRALRAERAALSEQPRSDTAHALLREDADLREQTRAASRELGAAVTAWIEATR